MSERTPRDGGAADVTRSKGSGPSPVTALSHIAIAVREADPLVQVLVSALGAARGSEELLDGGTLRVVFVHLGPVTLELLEPRSPEHAVARFLDTRGPGLHHVSLEVRDIAAQLARARAAGVRLIDEAPRPGAHGTQVAFLHPKSLGGVLVELCQVRSPDSP
jgi:methylmalonyl-CoA/ethylmalonyl-CoA epimerase